MLPPGYNAIPLRYGYYGQWAAAPSPAARPHYTHPTGPSQGSPANRLNLTGGYLPVVYHPAHPNDEFDPPGLHPNRRRAKVLLEEMLSRQAKRQFPDNLMEHPKDDGKSLKKALIVIPALIAGLGIIGAGMLTRKRFEIELVPQPKPNGGTSGLTKAQPLFQNKHTHWQHFNAPTKATEQPNVQGGKQGLQITYQVPIYREQHYQIKRPYPWLDFLPGKPSKEKLPHQLKLGRVETVPFTVQYHNGQLITSGKGVGPVLEKIRHQLNRLDAKNLSASDILGIINQCVGSQFKSVATRIRQDIGRFADKIGENTNNALILKELAHLSRQMRTISSLAQRHAEPLKDLKQILLDSARRPTGLKPGTTATLPNWTIALDEQLSATRSELIETSNLFYNQLSAQVNDSVKDLSLFLLIPSFTSMVASIFGMNVPLPGEKNDWTMPLISLGVPSVSTLAALLISRRMG